jgi:hypothetical protein
MKLVDADETIVLVIGSTESAAHNERPLAEGLQREIDGRGGGTTYRRALIVADNAYLDRPVLHELPTIALGGPGVNAVTQQFVGSLPTVWQEEERVFVQADLESEVKRVSLWGVDASATSAALDAFLGQGVLDLLLERVWRIRPQIVI